MRLRTKTFLGLSWALLGTSACPEGESAGDGAGARPASAEAEAKARGEDTAKRGGEGSGLAERVREIAHGAEPTDPVLPAGEGVAIPAAVPPGDIVIVHGCSHSMQPFGTGYWSSTTTVDLAKATIVSSSIEGDEADAHAMPGTKSSEKRTEHQTTLASADVARIRDALDRVLAGGPYAPVYAYSEGIVCTLELRVGDDPPFFQVDKSRPEREDAVTRLISALGVATPP